MQFSAPETFPGEVGFSVQASLIHSGHIAPPLIIFSPTAIIRPRTLRFVPGISIGDCKGGYFPFKRRQWKLDLSSN
jgi:hypothetical protein